MELRKTEETLQELHGIYESIRTSPVVTSILVLPPFPNEATDPPPKPEEESSSLTNKMETATKNDDEEETTPPTTTLTTVAEVCQHLQTIQHRLYNHETDHEQFSLPSKIQRFRQRLIETDPITKQPRYGEATQRRVQRLVNVYDHLLQHVPDPSNDTTNSTTTNDDDQQQPHQQHPLLQLLQTHAHQVQQQKQKEQEMLEQAKQQRAQEEIKATQQEAARQAKEQQRLAEQARQVAEQQAALAAQATLARQRRLEELQAEQAWVDSIPKGLESVQQQSQILQQATAQDDNNGQTIAIQSLHRMFQQICAHPEEDAFRRIRREHEQFVHDVGRHPGGVELLLAAGFELGTIDDVPCYLCKEPNLETDMDAWSAWFDLLKGTLVILQEAVEELKQEQGRKK